MASATQPLQPPPSPGGDASAPQAAPTSPTAVSPAPPTPSPAMQQGTRMMLDVVNGLRAIAKMFPGASPGVAGVHEPLRGKVMPQIMQSAEPGEPAAPPVGS